MHEAVPTRPRRPWRAPLTARSPHEPHRVATPLELFFDLVIVIAVARAAAGLHHAIADGHALHGVATYAMVFFAIWWAWVNFTWFASAYDNDDVAYRLLALLQLTGALVLAAGIDGLAHGHRAVATLGYVVMRAALVVQWLRAARADPDRRATALRYATGVAVVQAAWVALLLVPGGFGAAGFWVLAGCELLVPAWAERRAPTTWHAHHIAERYGLFTIITLGESVLAASLAVESATSSGHGLSCLVATIAGGLGIVFSCWWLYFERPGHEVLTSMRAAFVWGYGHYVVFASAAAIGAGLAVSVDVATGHAAIAPEVAGAAVAVPAALFLASLWWLHARGEGRTGRWLTPAVVVAILATPRPGSRSR